MNDVNVDSASTLSEPQRKQKDVAAERKTYTVSSGGFSMRVDADSPRDAALAAIKSRTFECLGCLVSILPDGDGEEEMLFMSAVRLCKDAGMWADTDAGAQS